ncbi:MAG: RICIN domain-containing protein [Clostridia bacterium]|nr:RICIN domain-containing protein [Clostridia bacterium]
MKKFISAVIAASMITVASAQVFSPITVQASSSTRYMENLDRGLVAMNTDNGIYLSWRLVGTEDYNSSFTVYRDGQQIATVSDSTNYLDTSGNMNSQYSVFSSSSSVQCSVVKPLASGSNFLDIPLAPIDNYVAPDGTSYPYEAKDASVGDLDGDGQYEIVIKREANRQHAGVAGFNHMFLEAYELDGSVLWRIDMGQNMRAMTEFAFLVYDFNNDGIAEIACKTAPGTKDATGRFVTEVSRYSWITGANNYADYHDSNGFVLTGPEYFSWFDGRNGAVIDTIDYPIFRGTDSNNSLHKIWGDNYGHRAEKCMATVAYLDGVNPSIVVWRGIYNGQPSVGAGRTALAAINISGSRLVVGNRFDTWSGGKGGYVSGNEQYIGNGNHSIAAGDIDGDGRDEVMSGGLCIDDDMTAKWCTYRLHGDAHHLSDYDPLNNSLEYFTVHEDAGTAVNGQTLNYGMTVIDASNGNQLFHVGADGDTGRGMMADVGAGGYYQFWGAGVYKGTGNNQFAKSSFNATSYNFRIFWDGDLYDELLDAESSGRKYNPTVFKYNSRTMGLDVLYTDYNSSTINGTKATPILQADIFGDWREEFISLTNDGLAMRIHTTNIPTTNKLYTLMHDPIYRMGVALQNQYYNQPPHIGYYVSNNYDQYDKRAVKPSIVTPVYNGSTPSLQAIPVESGVKTRNSKYIIDEDGDYYPTHSTIASKGETNGVWTVTGYNYAFMSAASSSVNNLWLTKDGMSNLDGRFLLFAANGKSSNFIASNPSNAITEDGKVEFDFSVPTTYSTDGYKLRGNAPTNIYIGDGSTSAVTLNITPTITDSYVTAATLTVNDEQICTYSSGAEAQSWTHVDCAISKPNNSATVTVTKQNGQKFTKTVSINCGDINTININPTTTWGTILLDNIKMYKTAGTPVTFWSEDFENSNKFSLITDGYSDYQFLCTDPSGANAKSGTVYGVGSRAGGDTGAQSEALNGSNYSNIVVDMDLKLDACMSGKGSTIGLIGEENKANWLSAASQILTIGATASGNGYWGSITINGVDITSKARVSGNESSGAAATSSGVIFNSLNRNTTGWLHLTASPDFDSQTVDVTLTRISDGSTVYKGTLDFVGYASSLERIYLSAGKYYGGTWIDNIQVTGVKSSSASATPAPTPTPVSEYADIAEGVYYIKSANSDMYLDVANGSGSNGANVQQNAFTGSTAQQFKVVAVDDGYYKLLTGCSDYTQAVDVSGRSTENGANILTWASGSGTNQQYKFKDAGDGKYAILTRVTSLASALDVANFSTEAGANVQQYAYWGGVGQQWYLEPVSSNSSSSDASDTSDSSDVTVITGTNKDWNMGSSLFSGLGTISSSTTVDELTLTATSAKTMKVSTSGELTVNGTSYSAFLALGGSGNTSYRSMKFDVAGPCTIKVIAKSSGSSDRTLAVSNGSDVLGTITAPTTLAEGTYSYTGGAGTIYIYSQNSGINVYDISVTY